MHVPFHHPRPTTKPSRSFRFSVKPFVPDNRHRSQTDTCLYNEAHDLLPKRSSAGSDLGPAEQESVAVADQTPSQPSIYISSAEDNPPDPSSLDSPSPTLTRPAPNPNPTTPSHPTPPQPQHPTSSRPSQASSSSRDVLSSASSATPAQILGRRQRAESEEEEEEGQDEARSETHPPDIPASRSQQQQQQQQPKRRRLGSSSMLTEVDHGGEPSRRGAARSSTAATAAPNGSHAGEGSSSSAAATSTKMQQQPRSAHGGGSRTNGGPAARPQTYFGHNRAEVTRILIQALGDLGYHAAADIVGEESGFEVESPDVVAFRQAVLGGNWARAEQLLSRGGAAAQAAAGPGAGVGGGGFVLAPGADRNAMRFRIRQQKFLELLEQRETGLALHVLRTELTPLCAEQRQTLHLLSRLLMCQDVDDLRARANWDGAAGRSRHLLLAQLSESISPSVMLPEHRLAALLDDLKQAQVDRCLYHTTDESPSLYTDHMCDRSRFPSEVLAELCSPRIEASKRTEEIWQIRFSPDGKRLASCGTDEAFCIWDAERLTLLHELPGHPKSGIGNLAWSPDSRMIATCGMDHVFKIWDAETGECMRTLVGFDEPVSSCVWASDGQTFITGSFDKAQSLCQWTLMGELLHSWAKTHRTEDVALSRDQRWLVAMDDRCNLHVYDFATRELVYDLALNARATCVEISRDSRYILVNKEDGEALLVDIDLRETVQKYMGHLGGQYTIRADFGGANENFVISGSEDGRVLIWHKMKGVLVHDASAHHTCCNAVAWNPADPCMFATAGDDGRIRIWSNRERTKPGPSTARHSNGGARNSSNGHSHYSEEMWP